MKDQLFEKGTSLKMDKGVDKTFGIESLCVDGLGPMRSEE